MPNTLAVEQHVRGARPISDSSTALDAEDLKTDPDRRFKLKVNYKTLFLIDKLTGAVVAKAVIPQRPDSSIDHFIAPDGTVAVIVSNAGEIFRWLTSANLITSVKFPARLEGKHKRISSIAFEKSSSKVALLISGDQKEDDVILISDAADGPGRKSIALKGLSGANIAAFVGGKLFLKLSQDHQSRIREVDISSEDVSDLVQAGESPVRISPDDRWLFALDASDRPCEPKGDFGTAGNDAVDNPSACVVALNLQNTKVERLGVPRETTIEEVSIAAGSETEPLRYELLLSNHAIVSVLAVAAKGDALEVVRPPADSGRVSWISGDSELLVPAKAEGNKWNIVPITLPTSSQIAIKSHLGSRGLAVARDSVGTIIAGYDSDDLTLFRFAGGGADLREPNKKLQKTAYLKIASPEYHELSSTEGAFDDGGRTLLLLATGKPTASRSNDGGTQTDKEGAEETIAAVLEISQVTTGAPVHWTKAHAETGSCRRNAGEAIEFSVIRYWTTSNDTTSPGRVLFVGVDSQGAIWRITVRSGHDGRAEIALPAKNDLGSAEVEIRCIRAFGLDAQILAVDDKEGYVIVGSETPSVVSLADTFMEGTGTPTSIRNLPSSRATSGTFIGRSKVALALQNGDIWIVERREGIWVAKPKLKNIASSVPYLYAQDTDLLIVGGSNSTTALPLFAVVIADVDGDSPKLVASAALPGYPDIYLPHLDGGARAIDLIDDGVLTRYPLPPVPREGELTTLIEARSTDAEETDRASISMFRRLVVGNNEEDEAAFDPSFRCRIGINEFLTHRESIQFEDRGVGQGSNDYPSFCDQLGPGDALNKLGKLLYSVKLTNAGIGWPPEWSALIQAAKSGETLALRGIALALAESGDQILKTAGNLIYKDIVKRGLIFPESTVNDIAAGRGIADDIKQVVEAQYASIDPTVHEVIGHLRERQVYSLQSRAEALLHFWIAEKLYGAAGRYREQALAATRRAMLARSLPDTLVEAVGAQVAGWRGQTMVASDATLDGQASTQDRMHEDVAALALIANRLVDEVPFRVLRAAITVSVIPQLQETSAATKAYSDALDILGDTTEVVAFGSELSKKLADWSDQLVKLNEEELATRAIVKALMLFESNQGVSERDFPAYRDVVAKTCEVLIGRSISVSALRELNFNLYTVQFSVRSFGSVPKDTLVQKLALLDMLVARAPDRLNWLVQRGRTRFWLGVLAYDEAENTRKAEGGKRSEDWTRLSDSGDSYLEGSLADFGKAVQSSSDWNILYGLAQTQVFRGSRDREDLVVKAAQGLERLLQAIDHNDWKGPMDDVSILYSHYVWCMDDLSLEALTRFEDGGVGGT